MKDKLKKVIRFITNPRLLLCVAIAWLITNGWSYTVTDLQMGGYLLIRDFRQRINKRGAPYGWPLSIYTTPEALWGYDHISSAYSVDPAESKTMIYEQVGKNFPDAAPGELDAVLGWTR